MSVGEHLLRRVRSRDHAHGECEALRLLREIVEGRDEYLPAAIAQAKALLRSYRVSPRYRTNGRPLTLSHAQLREIARLDGEARYTQAQIAAKVGTSRAQVAHHLRPSSAMLAALLE